MFTILATKEEVFHDYPQITEWIEIAEKLTGKDINVDKVEFLYSYGFFHPKVEDKEKYYTELFEKCSKMEYNQRVEFELSKVRVELTLKVGQFVLSNRIKDFLPQIIKDIVSEITKVKMLVEFEYHNNQSVKNSIPDVDKSVVSFEMIKDLVKSDYNVSLDIDDILDKIANNGMNSLTIEEKEFLDKKSKEM